MPLQDLAQSLPGVVAAALLPGFALATLVSPRWRWWQRFAMAPGLSAGFVGVFGLAAHDLHIPFEPLTILPALLVLGAAAFFRWRRLTPGPSDGPPWWVPIPALVAGALGAAIFVWALHGQVLPPDWDAPTHGGVVNSIVRTHDVLPLFPIPLEGTDYVRARPGFEATAAVVAWLGAPSPSAAMGPVIVVTLVLIPLSLTVLTLEATGSVALATVVPLFALGLAFPSDQAIVGRFPEIVDSTLIVPWIIAALGVLRGRNTRETAILLATITASIWVIHGLEILTALVVGGFLLAMTALRAVRAAPRTALIRVGIAAGATFVGAAMVTVLTRIPHVPPATHIEPPLAVPATVISSLPLHAIPETIHQVLGEIAQTDLTSPVALALYVIGVVALLIRRWMLWVLVAQVVFVLLMVDNFYLHWLNGFWVVVYPWGEFDRMLGLQYWLIPLVLGAGLFATADVMRSLSRTRKLQVATSIAALALVLAALLARHPLGHLWTAVVGKIIVYTYPLGVVARLSALRPWIPTAAVAAAVIAISWLAVTRRWRVPGVAQRRLGIVGQGLDGAGAVLGVLALLCLIVGGASELGVYQGAVVNRSLVTPADLTVLGRMSTVLRPGTLVMTDGGNDAGMWMAALTDLTPVVPDGYAYGALSIPLDIALADACVDPTDAEIAVNQVGVVFVGAHRIPASRYPWNVNCIARLSNVRLIASAPWEGTMAAAFEVIKP